MDKEELAIKSIEFNHYYYSARIAKLRDMLTVVPGDDELEARLHFMEAKLSVIKQIARLANMDLK